ncbi:MAG: hypothetical protein ACI9SC_000126 [Gammaproteobacteria bacterium]|jgi:uncharacterized protein (DUF1800 family)
MTVNKDSVIASNRFGFGAKPGDLVRIGASPKQWLLDQIQRPQTLSTKVASGSSAVKAFLTFRNKKRDQMQSGKGTTNDVKDVMNLAQVMRPIYLDHVMARSKQVIESNSPFYERLVHFWSNHFAVSADNPQMYGLVGALEVEAIRPNITGYFSNMLLAVETHPTMLTYLDNFQSIGPKSTMAKIGGKRRINHKFDINENLAREILELHTLGVNAGYTQADVTTFAKVISGWTYGGLFQDRTDRGKAGEFAFNDLMHEPGAKTILNKQYRQMGFQQGVAVLRDLALHPRTARHLATKLARHFVSDEPSEDAIDKLSQAYLQSKGYLPAMYGALVNLDEVWDKTFTKYKSPNDFVYSVFRTINYIPDNPQKVIAPLTVLGQAPFRPGSPAGWPDTARSWSGGEALFKRVELAVAVAEKVGNRIDPLALAEIILGSTLSAQSRREIGRADSGSQGLAMLFASPEFQRR